MFGVYSAVQAVFHFSEFLSIAWVNPSTLSIDTFVLNHSVAYGIAACSSWLEFVAERHYFPEMKEASFISYLGLLLCVCGDALRKLAMFTAKHNFNHNVQCEKMDDHELVTHGVYRLCRHPSYMGWFYWSIGTQVISCTIAILNGRNVEETIRPWCFRLQLILQNPFCFLAYMVASWKFFHDRILIEEITLLNFFGVEYVDYQKRVGTGLPFISGYKVNL